MHTLVVLLAVISVIFIGCSSDGGEDTAVSSATTASQTVTGSTDTGAGDTGSGDTGSIQ